jgi:putative flippase GtrA
MKMILLPRIEPLLSRLPPEQRLLLVQFFRFGVIGTLGFVWDTLVVYATAPFLGLYVGGLVSYLVAGTMNWLLNRVWTYRNVPHGAMHRQLAKFLLANSVGFLLNRGTYFALITTVPLCRTYLVLPVGAGGLAAMFVNFYLSRRLVFR